MALIKKFNLQDGTFIRYSEQGQGALAITAYH